MSPADGTTAESSAASAASAASATPTISTSFPAADRGPIHDLVGIGIGPFGLGLAALSDPLEDVDAVFLDQRPEFRWHPGMMLDGATIQVPFLADLVTMADPTSRYSFLAFLKATGRLYPFYIRESFYPLRSEYDAYCRWVADQLDSLRWSRRVIAVETAQNAEGAAAADDGSAASSRAAVESVESVGPVGSVGPHEHFVVTAEVLDEDGAVVGLEQHRGRHVVLGVGTAPVLPEPLRMLREQAGERSGPVVHTAEFLPSRERLLESGSITIVGSGQSAAEVYRDLLEETDRRGIQLDWITRSPRFFAMEYTKLTLEMTSPEYTDHYRSLPEELRDRLGREQRSLYKGISGDLVDDIHDTLYRLGQGGRAPHTTLLSDVAVTAGHVDEETGEHVLTLRHGQLGTEREHRTGALIAATGYRSSIPAFLDPVADLVRRDAKGRLDVSRDYTVDDAGRLHVLNAEEHTHGVTAPDLGFGAWRASVVLAAITGREPYAIERRIAFQTFGLPPQEDRDPQAAADDPTAAAATAAPSAAAPSAEAPSSAAPSADPPVRTSPPADQTQAARPRPAGVPS
ncbi:lysine N(6)-hydroxylase/L-ornithine N(5)-oxygenase family protein [Brachybacterium alimentarium]|uniref:lysine N(6)-hydroxylase/L-ornithine N(5)-oxygenase family protein n=1 Tax=Brachybacterium alimentarium TaxID=47845 RepID=UPI0031E23EC9